MRISEYYKLGRTQASLDFVDVTLDTDLTVFVNPVAIKSLQSEWGSECISLLQHYFESVLKRIKSNDKASAINLLSALSERNEFHLGYSRGKSRGHGFGSISGSNVWKALSESKAAKSNLLTDLEDTCLLIEGIGPDMISDAVCNIIRGPLIAYTQEMCEYYEMPMENQVDSGPIWNPDEEKWERTFVKLPVTTFGKLVLVPKIAVRFGMAYDVGEYYRYFLIPVMEQDEIKRKSELVETLKDGRKRVTTKELMKKYGAGKLSVVDQTVKRPEVLKRYKENKEKTPSRPLSHGDFAELEKIGSPNFEGFLDKVASIPIGVENSARYESAIEKLLTVMFYPSLCNPHKQHRIHAGRKRIDITYVNSAQKGFFDWLGRHYPASHIFVECKNYGQEVGNPEIDQLAGRFSPSRGKFGLLICRKIADKQLLRERCRDTAVDSRGFIIALDDEDLRLILNEYMQAPDFESYKTLKQMFDALIM